MAPPLWALSLPVGTVLIMAPRIVSLVLQIKSGAPLRNSAPRDHVASKEVAAKDTYGYVRRAFAAHQNSFESMILWSAAVMLAKVNGVDYDTMNTSAAVWLTARFLYTPAYVLITSDNVAFLRTFVFTIGMGATMRLMWIGVLNA